MRRFRRADPSKFCARPFTSYLIISSSNVVGQRWSASPGRLVEHAIAAPTDTSPPPPSNWNAFVQGLREAGYNEGRNIEFAHRSAHDQPELFPKLASELADLRVDVIFARGTWALAAAKNATSTIPIAGIDLEIDPVETGLVASIARPGGNVTGMFLDLSELSGKHLLGGIILSGSPGNFRTLIAEETEKWAKVIRSANIKPE